MATELGRAVEGEVRFDDGSRAMYAYDGSVYRQVPIGVVIPRHAGDVVAALDVCRSFDAPVFGRGCGTSLAGQCCNVAVPSTSPCTCTHRAARSHGAVRRVRTGTICDELRARRRCTASPSARSVDADHCTLGGMIGNNSCGTHS